MTPQRTGPWLLVICMTIIAESPASRAQISGAEEWTEIMARLERAALSGSKEGLTDVTTHLMNDLTRPSGTTDLLPIQYAMAYAEWRLAALPGVPPRERDELLDSARKRLEGVVDKAPRDVESLALLGVIYGQQAGRSTMKAIVLGPRSTGILDKAADLDRSNPRVLLLQGISAVHTPSAFGGSREKAERLLRRSLDEFSREGAAKAWPNWGRFDAHAWLGQVLRRKGDLGGARAEYDKALAIAPDSAWVRRVLLPALERTAK